MPNLRIKYLSFFFGLITILSFFNVIYSYYLNLYLNLNTYYVSFISSLLIALLFFKFEKQTKKISVFDKIYYNYYNTQKIDRNRTGFEVGGFITKKLFVQLYYVLQKQKSVSNSHNWKDTNVFGLDFSLKFK